MKKYQLIQFSDQSIIINNEDIKIIDTVNLIDFKKIIAGTEGLPKIDYSSLSEEDQEKIGYINLQKLKENYYEYWYDKYDNSGLAKLERDNVYHGYIGGFEAAQSLNDKKYTLEDLEKAHWHGWATREQYPHPIDNNDYENIYPDNWESMDYEEHEAWYFKQFIKKINKPKVFNIEIEMKEVDIPEDNDLTVASDGGYYSKPTHYRRVSRPKIENNYIKITKVKLQL